MSSIPSSADVVDIPLALVVSPVSVSLPTVGAVDGSPVEDARSALIVSIPTELASGAVAVATLTAGWLVAIPVADDVRGVVLEKDVDPLSVEKPTSLEVVVAPSVRLIAPLSVAFVVEAPVSTVPLAVAIVALLDAIPEVFAVVEAADDAEIDPDCSVTPSSFTDDVCADELVIPAGSLATFSSSFVPSER